MTQYSGDIPDKAIMDKDTFANSINPYLNYFNDTFVPEATALELNIETKETSAVAASAAAVAAANFQGTWTNEITAIGQSWEYGGVIYGVLVAGTDSPITTPSNWFALTIAQNIKNTPSGGISATTVQGALNELDTEKISASSIHSATTQATPLDADEFGYISETSPGVFELVKMTGANVKAWLLAHFDTLYSRTTAIFGIGQTWQDVGASRAQGVTYTNSTGKPIQVVIRSVCTTTSANVLQVDSIGVISAYQTDAATGYAQLTATVPSGSTYALLVISGSPTFDSWKELR